MLLPCGKTQLMEHDDSLVVAYFQLVTQSSIICLVNKGYIVHHSQGFVLKLMIPYSRGLVKRLSCVIFALLHCFVV